MESSNWISLGAILVSTIALTVSIIAIWNTHFKQFTPLITTGFCKFRIYPIKSGKEKWFIPSFDIPISITNKGAQVGKIENFRIRLTFPELPIKNHYENFNAKWVVDGKDLTKHRFDWIDKNVIGYWMPILVLPKETKSTHLVLESFRWEDPVIQSKLICTLEYKAENKTDYEKVDSWTFRLDAKSWVDMVESGRGRIASSEKNNHEKDYIMPKDLHKYTGTKEEIPNKIKKSEPSYLNYKEENE